MRDAKKLYTYDPVIFVIVQYYAWLNFFRFHYPALIKPEIKRITILVNFNSHVPSSTDDQRMP